MRPKIISCVTGTICPIYQVGEDTGGDIYWCPQCGRLIESEPTKIFTPIEYDVSLDCVEESGNKTSVG